MARTRLNLEALDSRALPSATLVNGVLTVEGTSGRDTIVVSQTGTTLSVEGEPIEVNGTLVDSIDVSDVSRISVLGRGGSDTISLVGVAVDTHVSGGSGHDVITGGSGDDGINGGGGNDTCRGGGGDDTIAGASGNDGLTGGGGDDSLSGGGGDDRCNGGGGNDQVRGDDGSDFCLGGGGDDRVNGGIGDDRIFGGSGSDRCGGGGGNDSINDDDRDEGLNPGSVEGTITAINLGASTVTITTVSGVAVTVTVVPGTNLERFDVHVGLGAFQVGDWAEADFNSQNVASKLEAE